MKHSYSLVILLIIPWLLVFALEVSGEEQSDGILTNLELTANVINAYGGRQTIERLKAVYASGNIEAYMLQDRGVYERFFRRDRKLKIITTYARSSETRILNNKRGFRGADRPLEEVHDHRLLAMIYHFKHLDMPYGLMTDAYAISSRRSAEFQGREVEILRLIDVEGPVMDIFIDRKTFYIVKVTGFFTVAGKTTELSAEFLDFRGVGNTVLPFRVVNYGSGQKIAETTITSYELYQDLPDTLFEP